MVQVEWKEMIFMIKLLYIDYDINDFKQIQNELKLENNQQQKAEKMQ